MTEHRLFLEGGGDSKAQRSNCRKAFVALLNNSGLGCRPRVVACGGRESTFDKFKRAHTQSKDGQFIAMLIDSEDPAPIPMDPLQQKTWDHLWRRDSWTRPHGATDLQVLLMTTCMETWIAADREALRQHYGHQLIESRLPSTVELESQNRHDLADKLARATEQCKNSYRKGDRSFDLLSKLRPKTLHALLPSFRRSISILKQNLLDEYATIANAGELPAMTPGRAALIFLMLKHATDPLHPSLSIIKAHNLLYFLQESQEPLMLRYVKAPSGPCAENLHDLLQEVEGHFIEGFIAGVNNPGRQLAILEGAAQQATECLTQHPETQARCQRVCDLMSAFDSPFGLALLAPVHWLQTREQPRSMQELVQFSQSWSPPMERFTADEIRQASIVLSQQGWVEPLA